MNTAKLIEEKDLREIFERKVLEEMVELLATYRNSAFCPKWAPKQCPDGQNCKECLRQAARRQAEINVRERTN